MCGGGGVCVGDWVGDGMVFGGGGGVELHTEKLIKEILCKFY